MPHDLGFLFYPLETTNKDEKDHMMWVVQSSVKISANVHLNIILISIINAVVLK